MDGRKVLGNLSALPSLRAELAVEGAVVAIGDNGVRRDFADQIEGMGLQLINAIHPSANLDELKHSKMISRGVIVLALAVGVWIALQAKGILYTIIIFNYPYMGSMLVPLLGGVIWARATVKGAIAAIITGGAIGVGSFLVGIPGPLNGLINIDLGLLIAYGVSTVVFIVVSLNTSTDHGDPSHV